jgi:hypothetical protein
MNTRSARRFYSDFVVDCTLNPLIANEISLGGLNRNLTEEKLDLLQFAPGGVANPCQVLRRSWGANLSTPALVAYSRTHVPDRLFC